MTLKPLFLVCLLNFLIAAAMGLAMRFVYIYPLDLNYRFLTHAHSHTAMLGWVYLMLFTLITHHFVPNPKSVFTKLFWVTEFAVLGMLISFPFQGYAAVSITFSTLHIFCSYYFVRLIFKHAQIENNLTRTLLKTALVFMLVSTIGVWCLGPAVGILGQASAFYQIAIQFFLHFQFNGWFLIGLLALLFNRFQIKENVNTKRFYILLVISTISTLALPVSWYAPHPILNIINSIGVLCQLGALYYFFKLVKPKFATLTYQNSKLLKYLYTFSLGSFVFKIILQSSSFIPAVALMAKQQHNFVIGFIHLTMLGVVSGFLFAFLIHTKIAYQPKYFTWGVYSFILGFLGTEGILFLQGVLFTFEIGLMPKYYLLLFILSTFLVFGILLIIMSILHTNTNYNDRQKTIKTT
ncbi:hypothetical protein [Formosa sp. L2A11]|uniref:hypothetical protein n=1 Tax=Formosa sp. L2A11 TaxID=2686363 RepID=UPI00131E989E|nr:hypothetical protein [Formosa sp. L2A11]